MIKLQGMSCDAKPFQPLQMDVGDCVSQEGSDMKRNPAAKMKSVSGIVTSVKKNTLDFLRYF